MGGLTSLATRFAAIVLLVHVVLLPALYLQLDRIVTRSYREMFVTEIRTYARIAADELESGDVLDSEDRTRALLENVLLSGEGQFAELVEPGRSVYVRVVPPGHSGHFLAEDFEFGQGDDDVYYLSTPVLRGDRRLALRIGFDERPVMAQIARTRTRIVVSLGGYFVLALLLATFLGWRLSRPMVALQRASRRVAAGETDLQLATGSTIAELRGLSEDLERMRAELVDVSRRLREEMTEREREAARRGDLEQQLQARQRLESVGTLAGGIAHEFNNLLVPIQLYTEMAIEDLGQDNPTRADLERVLASARRARRVVRDILSFTRRPRGVGLQAVDLASVVHDVVDVHNRIPRPGVSIRCDTPPGHSWVEGDADMLHQVVTNLLVNAIHAVEEEGGAIELSIAAAAPAEVAAAELPPGEYIALRVRDSGHGMDAATRQRIFEPFFTTRPVGKGTGLGLSVVHGMVDGMGGAVSVASEPAAGAEFSVFLRKADPSQAAAG